MSLTGRTFTASLKPAWETKKMVEFCRKMKGDAVVFCINHSRDFNVETGEIVEIHTHILIEYETPRKISTVANLLKVEPNFIELVKSKKGMLRYLTHQGESDKTQYSVDDVITNSAVSYSDMIMGQSLSDREIAQYLVDGKGLELLGVVSASKLRTIQSFLAFDRSGIIKTELAEMSKKLDKMNDFIDKVEAIANELKDGVHKTSEQLILGVLQIASEIEKVRNSRQDSIQETLKGEQK